MACFGVWAPHARERVEIEADGTRTPMQRRAGDWWWAELPGAGAGLDYAYVLDGGKPLPDPRSAYQPQGVHGPSRTVDHDAFDWTDDHWRGGPLSAAVLYELHVGTFTPEGTFEAVIDRIGPLQRLGVTHIELMPVNEFAGDRGWGYDGASIFAPHHAYGGPVGLKRLIDACHHRGLGVVLDVVYNHFGPEGTYLNQFGPYLTDRYRTRWGQAVNLDGRGSDEVRRLLLDNARMWLRDYHLDGLRIDGVHAILDMSALHWLEELAVEAQHLQARTGRPVFLIGESDLNDPRVVRPREAGGYGLDAQWSDDFHHALHSVLTGETDGYYRDFGRLEHLAKACRQAFVYDGQHSADRNRRHGRPPTGLGGQRFLGYLQNHDQIGNRAAGERIGHLISPARLKVGAALVLCGPFVPMLFQGQEWAASAPFQYFTDYRDPQLAQAVRQGRRDEFAKFGWDPADIPDPQDEGTFLRCKLDWFERDLGHHAELLDWHRRLIRLRRETPDLSAGPMENVAVEFNEDARWFVLRRGRVTIACNLAPQRQAVPVGDDVGELRLASETDVTVGEGSVELPPDSVAILCPPAELLRAEAKGGTV